MGLANHSTEVDGISQTFRMWVSQTFGIVMGLVKLSKGMSGIGQTF